MYIYLIHHCLILDNTILLDLTNAFGFTFENRSVGLVFTRTIVYIYNTKHLQEIMPHYRTLLRYYFIIFFFCLEPKQPYCLMFQC